MDDRKALEGLRLSIRRIAQATKEPNIIKMIPGGGNVHSVKIAERGWNRLCLEIVEWMERKNNEEQ